MIKKVAGAYYAHKSNIDELLSFIPLKHRELVFAVCELCDKEYTVVKYTEEAVTLIYSPDWDTAMSQRLEFSTDISFVMFLIITLSIKFSQEEVRYITISGNLSLLITLDLI